MNSPELGAIEPRTSDALAHASRPFVEILVLKADNLPVSLEVGRGFGSGLRQQITKPSSCHSPAQGAVSKAHVRFAVADSLLPATPLPPFGQSVAALTPASPSHDPHKWINAQPAPTHHDMAGDKGSRQHRQFILGTRRGQAPPALGCMPRPAAPAAGSPSPVGASAIAASNPGSIGSQESVTWHP